MKIKRISVGEINLPLARPFKTALRTVEHVNDIVVRIEADDGTVGYGEAPPTAVITGDTKGSILCAIQEFIAPSLVGMDVEDMEGLQKKLHACILKNTSAKAAVDMALYDLLGKRFGVPLYQLLGGAKNEIETDITISVNPIDEMVADSVDAVRQGFRVLKVKVGKEGKADVERIRAIRQACPDAVIRVDANQGWTAGQAISIIKAMEDAALDIELVEQPVPAHDFEGMKAITRAVETPILADESVFCAEDAIKIIQHGAADLLNIKLMKTGGIWKALQICSVADIYGVKCMMGCMLESRLSVAAGAHLAAAKGCITLCDLDGPSLCSVDPYTGGPIFEGAKIRMSADPGIGVDNIPCTCWD